jgi:hypothetical protein
MENDCVGLVREPRTKAEMSLVFLIICILFLMENNCVGLVREPRTKAEMENDCVGLVREPRTMADRVGS